MPQEARGAHLAQGSREKAEGSQGEGELLLLLRCTLISYNIIYHPIIHHNYHLPEVFVSRD